LITQNLVPALPLALGIALTRDRYLAFGNYQAIRLLRAGNSGRSLNQSQISNDIGHAASELLDDLSAFAGFVIQLFT
jgi:hypothetical protein